MVGLGNLLVLQNLRSASVAPACVGKSLLGPQSKSIKNDLSCCTFICLRLVGSLNVPRAKKTLYLLPSSSADLSNNSSTEE